MRKTKAMIAMTRLLRRAGACSSGDKLVERYRTAHAAWRMAHPSLRITFLNGLCFAVKPCRVRALRRLLTYPGIPAEAQEVLRLAQPGAERPRLTPRHLCGMTVPRNELRFALATWEFLHEADQVDLCGLLSLTYGLEWVKDYDRLEGFMCTDPRHVLTPAMQRAVGYKQLLP